MTSSRLALLAAFLAAPFPAAAQDDATAMVPSTAELADRLRAIKRGDLVEIRGYLVEIKFPNGGK